MKQSKGERPIASAMHYLDLKDLILVRLAKVLGSQGLVDYWLVVLDPEDEDFFFCFRRNQRRFEYYRDKNNRLAKRGSSRMQLFIRSLELKEMTLLPKNNGERNDAGEERRRRKTHDARYLIVPVRIGAETRAAVVALLGKKTQTPSAAMRRSLRALGEEIAAALPNCHSHELQSQQLAEASALWAITSMLQMPTHIEDVLRRILNATIDVLGFDRALLSLVEPKTRTLEGKMTIGYEETLGEVNWRIDESPNLLSEVARTGIPRVVKNVRRDRRIPEFIRAQKNVWQAAIVPLKAKGETIGILSADHRTNRGQITPPRLRALVWFASKASIAIENARLYQEIERHAETDALTRLYNRYYFDKVLARENPRVKRYHTPLSLLMIDVEGFKRYNDTYGHVAGDEILKATARLLEHCVRDSDIVARYGGDEFVVLMPNTGEEQALAVARRIEKAVRESVQAAADRRERFQLSIGLTSADASDVDHILENADRAMYRSRELHFHQSYTAALLSDNLERIEELDHFVCSIVRMLYSKEMFYYEHSRRVLFLAVKICNLLNLSANFTEAVAIASLLHDIGKISIEATILNKPKPLTKHECDIIKTHPVVGDDLLKDVVYWNAVREIIRSHHERYDGKTEGEYPGYPEGLDSQRIPLGARIVKVADAFDALTSDRPYREAMSITEAIAVLESERGKSFDPQVVDCFVPHVNSHRAAPRESAAAQNDVEFLATTQVRKSKDTRH